MENNENNVILNGEPVDETPNAEPTAEAQTTQTPPPVNPQGGYNPNYSGAPVRPCPVCGEEYTYVCPKCGFSPYVGNKSAKSGIFRKWWFWLIAATVAFGLIIGTASCTIFLFSGEDTTGVASYEKQSLCAVGDLEVSLVPEHSYRTDYSVYITIEVKNKGKEDVSFYPTKALLDGEKALAYEDFHLDDSASISFWNYDSMYAEDGSVIIGSGNTHLVEISFDLDVDTEEYEETDHRKFKELEFRLNVADPETLSVADGSDVTLDLTKFKAEKKYYEYE